MDDTKTRDSHEPPDRREAAKHQVRLPGFITDADIGLGDAVTRATTYLGIRPCGGCKRRASALNRWVTFTR
jgi:hypothetical protein